MTLNGLLTALLWLGIAAAGWLVIAFVVGVFLGHTFRGRDHHYPSPNHPAVRSLGRLCDNGHPISPAATCTCPVSGRERPEKTLHTTDDRPPDPGPPLTPRETAVLDQLREQLR